jgi:hypothetical protein
MGVATGVQSRHAGVANAAIAVSRVGLVAVRRRAVLVVPKASVHIQGVPSGAAAAADDDFIGEHVVVVMLPVAGEATC